MDWCSDSNEEYLSDADEMFDSVANFEEIPNGTGKPYNVLNLQEIERRQNEEITQISSLFSISESAAIALLHHYRWNVTLIHDKWFSDEKSVRQTVGIMERTVANNNTLKGDGVVRCGVCFDDFNPDEVFVATCRRHPYCKPCWKGYITVAISDTGLGCLSLRCPEPKCRAIVGRELILKAGSTQEAQKYLKYLLRSYIECKKDRAKWCPAPGCENAVEIELDDGSNNGYDVVCDCGFPFCWNCSEDCHRPVDCDTVRKWMVKNSSEAENTSWILAYSKPCPKCKRPIEKNHGCNHMTCSAPCRHEFCWLCLGDYRKHGACNSYNPNKAGAKWRDEDEMKRILAKKSLERYTHYYERWASNQKSRNKAMEDLQKMKTQHLKPLSDKVKVPEVLLNFILDAWSQIIECRRVLKWTYAYGYYIPDKQEAKIQLFECLQGEAESALERLHACAERELTEKFLGERGDELKHDFEEFRPRLVGLTKVTRSFFENLVRALENGLSEADSPVAKKKQKGSSSSGSGVDDWNCDRCTYLNRGTDLTCQICLEED